MRQNTCRKESKPRTEYHHRPLIPRNPCEDCIVPKPRKLEMKILPPEHIKAYLDAAEARGLFPMFYLELVSGLRKGELVALRWDDLDIQGRTISVSKQYVRNPDGSLELTRPKTENSVRLVSIPQTAVDLLIQEHSKYPDSPYMFPSPLAPHRRDVPPGQRGKPPQENSEGRRVGVSQIS